MANRPFRRNLIPFGVDQVRPIQVVGGGVGEGLIQVGLGESGWAFSLVFGVDDGDRTPIDPPDDIGSDVDRTVLENAVGYGCWDVARLLVARGADVDQPWIAASLGLLDRLAQLLGDKPSSEQVSQAFWHACSGGQRRAAEYLLGRGADLDWVPDYAKGTPLDAATGEGTQRENLIGWLRDHGAHSAESDG